MQRGGAPLVSCLAPLYVAAYTMFGPARLFSVGGVDVRPSHVVLFAGSACGALALASGRRPWPPLVKAFFAVGAALLAWLAVSWSVTSGPRMGLLYVLNYGAAMATVVLIVGTATERRHVEATIAVLLVVTALGALLGALQSAASPHISLAGWVYGDAWQLDYGPVGYDVMPTGFALSMLVGYVLALSQHLDGKATRAVQAGLVCGLAGLLMAGTRSSLLAACLATAFLWLRTGVLRGARLIARLAVLAAVLGVAVCLWFPASRLQFYARVAVAGHTMEHWNTQSRLISWRTALDAWRERPITGFGIGRYREVVVPRLPKDIGKYNLWSHNVFLGLGVETGALGVGLYIALLGIGFAAAWRVPGALGLGLQAVILAHCVDSFFHNHQFDNHLWVLIGLSLVAVGMEERECAPATSTR